MCRDLGTPNWGGGGGVVGLLGVRFRVRVSCFGPILKAHTKGTCNDSKG